MARGPHAAPIILCCGPQEVIKKIMHIYIFKKLYVVLKFKTKLKFNICAFCSEKVYCSKRLDHPVLR